MKKTLTFLLAGALALALLAPAASATGLRLGFAYWDAGDVSDVIDDPLLGAEAAFAIPVSQYLDLELRFGCLGMSESESQRIDNRYIDADYDMVVVPVEAGLALDIPLYDGSPLHVFGGGGIGWYFFQHELTIEEGQRHSRYYEEWSWDENDSTFGAYAAAGVRLILGENVSLYGQAQYRWLFDEIDLVSEAANGKDIEDSAFLGLDPSGFCFSAGIAFNF